MINFWRTVPLLWSEIFVERIEGVQISDPHGVKFENEIQKQINGLKYE